MLSFISCPIVVLALLVIAMAMGSSSAEGQQARTPQPAEQLPRKLVIATTKSHISGNKQARLDAIRRLIDTAANDVQQRFGRPNLDLIVLPEFALHEGVGQAAREQAITADDPAVLAIADLARKLNTYIVLPVILSETAWGETVYANAALLLDRGGNVAGTYRKAHPITTELGVFENGVRPGESYPVFDCDFGRLGILICWDMCYEDAWRGLADAGAEVVAVPSASPQTIRPAGSAQRYRYWVVTATPRDNASIFDPIGIVSARTESADVLVHQIDLSSAIVHWNPTIENGQAFARAYGERGGFTWSTREDTGLFWSNDPAVPVAEMLRQMNVPQMDVEVERMARETREAVRK